MQPSSCSYCGQTMTAHPNGAPPSAPSTTEEIASIMEQTQRLNEAISALNATRAKLLRRLNILQSPTSNLAPEILSTIFTHVSDISPSDSVEDSDNVTPEIHTQITLSAVSSYWRQIICSTPRLWATTLINVKPKTVGLKTELLELYLKNVRDVPFSLVLGMLRTYTHVKAALYYHPIFQAIQKGVQKFIHLDLSSSPESWLPLLFPHFQKLEDLHLKWTWRDHDADDSILQISHLSDVPSLRRVSLEGCLINRALPDQPCRNITALQLVFIPLQTCVQLLMLCPNLIEYRCERCFSDLNISSPEDRRPSSPATFHNMRFFQAPNSTSMPFCELFPSLHFPILETFSLELDSGTQGMENLLAFIRRLPETCSTLEVGGYYMEEAIARVIPAAPPQVQSLRLSDSDTPRLSTVLRALSEKTHVGSFSMVGLQHFHMVSWCGGGPIGDHEKLNQQMFLAMLSARKELLGGRFTLGIDFDHVDLSWMHLQDRLRKIVFEGLRLEILVSGTLIPALQEIYKELDS